VEYTWVHCAYPGTAYPAGRKYRYGIPGGQRKRASRFSARVIYAPTNCIQRKNNSRLDIMGKDDGDTKLAKHRKDSDETWFTNKEEISQKGKDLQYFN
jgi:hypothetical protein